METAEPAPRDRAVVELAKADRDEDKARIGAAITAVALAWSTLDEREQAMKLHCFRADMTYGELLGKALRVAASEYDLVPNAAFVNPGDLTTLQLAPDANDRRRVRHRRVGQAFGFDAVSRSTSARLAPRRAGQVVLRRREDGRDSPPLRASVPARPCRGRLPGRRRESGQRCRALTPARRRPCALQGLR